MRHQVLLGFGTALAVAMTVAGCGQAVRGAPEKVQTCLRPERPRPSAGRSGRPDGAGYEFEFHVMSIPGVAVWVDGAPAELREVLRLPEAPKIATPLYVSQHGYADSGADEVAPPLVVELVRDGCVVHRTRVGVGCQEACRSWYERHPRAPAASCGPYRKVDYSTYVAPMENGGYLLMFAALQCDAETGRDFRLFH